MQLFYGLQLCFILLTHILAVKNIPVILSHRLLLSNSFPCARKPYNCSCTNPDGYTYNLECPGPNSPNDFSIELSFMESYIIVTCNGEMQDSDLHYLNRIKLTSIDQMEFYHCPLPGVPFKDVFQISNILEIQIIVFNKKELNQQRDVLSFHLDGLVNLVELDLSGSPMEIISPDALQGVPNLDKLYLRDTQLVTILKDAMGQIPKLTELDLTNNSILCLSPQAFSKLTSLQVLLLNDNRLEDACFFNYSLENASSDGFPPRNGFLSPDIFQGLQSLKILEIQRNFLKTLPENFFIHVGSLAKLHLNNNQFGQLPANTFRPLTNLRNLDIYNNKELVLPEGNFEHTSNLYRVYAERSGIQILLENTFRGAKSVEDIDLSYNSIRSLPERIFDDTTSLKILNLRGNQINRLPPRVFSHLGALDDLDLSENQILNIPEQMFWETSQLRKLNIANNRLIHFSPNIFLRGRCQHLTFLDLSNNNLSYPYDSVSDPFLNCYSGNKKFLTLSGNRFKNLTLTYSANASESQIWLNNNNISYIHWVGLEDSTEEANDSTYSNVHADEMQMDLSRNPIACDCQNYLFFRYIQNGFNHKVYEKINLVTSELYCGSPPSLMGRPLSNVSMDEVMCSVDCPESSPCLCQFRPHDKALLVNCQDMSLTAAPKTLPTYINANHTILNISKNAITSLPIIIQSGYEHVTEIYASQNMIGSLDLSSIPKALQVLELHQNNLTTLETTVADYLKDITELHLITLHDNPWSCGCEDMPFIELVKNKSAKNEVLLPDHVKCFDGTIVSSLAASTVCKSISIWTIVSTTVLLPSIVVLALMIIYYRYHKEVKIWLFANHLCVSWVTEQELDQDKEYDAFVCFSYKDEDFVENELIPNLTSGPNPFKLCIHTHNWLPGEYITNQIVESVGNSRRTIIVLSPNFLESEWGKLEFRVAHAQSLKEGRARIIVILYAEVGLTENLDEELQAYLNINTYVKWGDPKFWDKLRYALPHLPKKNVVLDIALEMVNSKNELDCEGEEDSLYDSPSVKEILENLSLPETDGETTSSFWEVEDDL